MFKVDYSVLFWSETEEDWKWEENKGEMFSSEKKEEAEAFIQNAIKNFGSDYILDINKLECKGAKYKSFSLIDRRLALASEKHVWALKEV